MKSSVQKVAVIGAGTMGHGIAQVAALAGFDVTLSDADPEALSRALEKIRDNLGGGIARGKLTEKDRDAALNRIATTPKTTSAVATAELCIESIVEDIERKREVFAVLERYAPPEAVLATNTSSLRVGRIAERLSDPRRVIGMHFFNPAHIMKLVEVVVQEKTLEEAKSIVLDVVARLGKTAIVVNDSPGFATSRLGVVLGLEAMRMVEQGVASPADIDTAMELGYKHPVGPLKLTDIVGLDVRLAVAETLYEELGEAHYKPPRLLRAKVEAGELGKKSGKGFYDWDK